jgi:hypothetical protein
MPSKNQSKKRRRQSGISQHPQDRADTDRVMVA